MAFQAIDPAEDANFQAFQAMKARRQQIQQQIAASPQTPLIANALTAHYPLLQPGVIAALAQAGIQPGNPIAEAANARAPQAAQRKTKDKGWFHDFFNGTIRGASTALQFLPQEIAGVVRTSAHNVQEHGVVGALAAPFTDPNAGLSAVTAQTDVGQINQALTASGGVIQHGGKVGEMFRQADVQTGSGFFVNPESEIGKAQSQAARDAYTVDGHAFTLGRGAAGVVFEPDTLGYNLLSGAIDFGVAVGDPTNALGGEVSKIRQANRSLQAAVPGRAPVLPEVLDSVKQAAGLMRTHRPATAPEMAEQWLSSDMGGRVVQRLAEMDSPHDVRQALRKKVDVETARELADANTPEAVREVFIRHTSQGRISEKPYTNAFSTFKPVMGAGLAIKRWGDSQRFLASVPGAEFVLGDITQSTDQLERTLRNAKFGREEMKKWTDQMARTQSMEERRTTVFNALGAMASKLAGEPDPASMKVGLRVRQAEEDNPRVGTITSINPTNKTAQVDYVDRVGGTSTSVSVPLTKLRSDIDDARGRAAEDMVRLYGEDSKGLNSYNTRDIGEEVGIEGLTIDGNGHAIPQPVLISQLSTTLPGLSRKQVVEIRRATSPGARLLTSGAYTRSADVARKAGNVWRSATLLRGAYTVRVIAEEQLRMAANSLDSLLSFHPASAIAYAIGSSNPKIRAFGKEIDVDQLLQKAVPGYSGGRGGTDLWNQTWEDQAALEGFTEWQRAQMKLHGDKKWAQRSIYNGWLPGVGRKDERYNAALSSELRQLHNDPLVKRLAGGWTPSDDAIRTGNNVEDLKEWGWNGKGQEFRMQHAERGGNWAKLADDREAWNTYVDGIYDLLRHKTGDDYDLLGVVGHGLVREEVATKGSVEALIDEKARANIGPGTARLQVSEADPERLKDMNRVTNRLFDFLMGIPSNKLSRSPAFRQYYWQKVGEMMPQLSKQDQDMLLAQAVKTNLDTRRLQGMQRNAKLGATGDIQLADLDQLAKGAALDRTQKLLYDLGDRSQFFDQMRIVMPFGEAWKEVMTTWARTFSQNPHQLNRLGQFVTANEEADPTNSGQGFFYTDEFGKEVFNYPLTGDVGRFITSIGGGGGVTTPLKGAVSGLNVIGNGMPGIGPVIQIGLDELVKRVPNSPDWVRSLFMPAGSPDTSHGMIEAFFPGWSKKMLTAKMGHSTDTSAFGTDMGRIMQAKATTGEYDTSTDEGLRRLQDDSSKSARAMLVFQGLVQFVAPTAPSPRWMAKDKSGNLVTVQKLLQDYNDLRAANFQTADDAFLARYGDRAFLYMQSLSEGGFPPLTELHDWVKEHPDEASAYRLTYGYFAGAGGEFSSPEFERQFALGERQKFQADKWLGLANHRVAALQYKQARDLMGPKPSAQARVALSDLQATLRLKYPGYEPGTTERGGRDAAIVELSRALEDPRLANTDIGRAAIRYMTLRKAVAEIQPGYKTANAGVEARAALRQYGDSLSQRTPAFSRMWIDLLSRELKEDEGASQ